MNASAPWVIDPGLVKWMQFPQTEEQLLLRECIPPYCWRATELPNGCELRYLGKEDVTTLVPWLSRLASVMQDCV